MPETLDDNVAQFLLHNPFELELIRRKVEAAREKAQREQLKAMQARYNEPLNEVWSQTEAHHGARG